MSTVRVSPRDSMDIFGMRLSDAIGRFIIIRFSERVKLLPSF